MTPKSVEENPTPDRCRREDAERDLEGGEAGGVGADDIVAVGGEPDTDLGDAAVVGGIDDERDEYDDDIWDSTAVKLLAILDIDSVLSRPLVRSALSFEKSSAYELAMDSLFEWVMA